MPRATKKVKVDPIPDCQCAQCKKEKTKGIIYCAVCLAPHHSRNICSFCKACQYCKEHYRCPHCDVKLCKANKENCKHCFSCKTHCKCLPCIKCGVKQRFDMDRSG